MRTMFLAMMFAAGCGEEEADDTAAVDDTGETDDTADTDTDTDTDTDSDTDADTTDPILDCPQPQDLGGLLDVAHTVLIDADLSSDVLTGDRVITTQADWDALLADLAVAPTASPDFSMERVLVSAAYVSSTCGLTFNHKFVVEYGGGTLLDVSVTDSSGGCEAACDALGLYVVAVAVPADGTSERICTRVLPECTE